MNMVTSRPPSAISIARAARKFAQSSACWVLTAARASSEALKAARRRLGVKRGADEVKNTLRLIILEDAAELFAADCRATQGFARLLNLSEGIVGPDGTTTTVPVNAGQLKKLDFAVAEDTTGIVTVNAPGLAKSFTYAKNCTKVLGEKHVIKTPKPPTKVLGEKKELPFTGFDTRAALFDAASLMALGAIVCALAMPRRRRFAPCAEG